ncbi:hypothetical protein E2C01_040136 [Portunus trituberculatus]|uniref:Uncharacterized protein n=1 Tax=Portunus trituberculatus TaxID=210409 RepID=A0A5B7FLR7_PORTR|nr:hypothetical protein [Portunus trituberculatus]
MYLLLTQENKNGLLAPLSECRNGFQADPGVLSCYSVPPFQWTRIIVPRVIRRRPDNYKSNLSAMTVSESCVGNGRPSCHEQTFLRLCLHIGIGFMVFPVQPRPPELDS